MWSSADIEVDLVYDDTSDPVMTVTLVTPAGTLRLMFNNPQRVGGSFVLHDCHMQGEDVGTKRFGHAQLFWLAQAVMEKFNVKSLRIEGAVRTSGARPGHRPRPFRFTRQVRPDT